MKNEIRVLGIDDSPFYKSKDKETLLIATFFRGGNFIDGILTAKATIDGSDSTEVISRMVLQSKFYRQIQCIMLDGIAVGGFNIVDINELSRATKIPVVVVVRDYPDFKKIFLALKKLEMHEKIKLIERAGRIIKLRDVFVQLANINEADAYEMIRITATHSKIPEPIRAAHIIASGIAFGESRGKA